VVLSGGGPRSLAHAGVLQALDEMRIPVDLIVGTSGGALVGGFAAIGLSPEQVRDTLLHDFDFFGLFDDQPERRLEPMRLKERDFNYVGYGSMGIGPQGFRMLPGLTTGRRARLHLRRELAASIGHDDFSLLPTPFRAAATDLAAAQEQLFDGGDLAECMMASLAVPTVFAPVRVQGRLYSDGLLFDNLPVKAALERHPRAIVLVDVTTPIQRKESYESVVSVAMRLLDSSIGDNMRRQLEALRPGDVVLRPQAAELGNFDYAHAGIAFERGRQTALDAAAQLKPLALSPEAYARWKAARPLPLRRQAWTLAEVRVDPPALRALAQERLPLKLGQPIDLAALEAAINLLYTEGRFEDIDFHVVPLDGERARLELELREKSWGPNFLGLGFKLVSDLQGFDEFEVLAEWTRTGLDAWGAELRQRLFLGRVHGLESEWYQPLGSTPFYVAPGLQLQGRLGLMQANASADLGWVLGRCADLRAGVVAGRFWAPPPSSNDWSGGTDLGGLRLQLTVDSLDDPHFPSRGSYVRGALGEARRDLSSVAAFRYATGAGYQALHLGPHVILLGADVYSTLDSYAPVFQAPRQGGFLHMTGYPSGAFQGQEALAGKVIYYYRQRHPLAPFGETMVYGVALEMGQVYAGAIRQDAGREHYSASLLVGASSYIGPVYLAHGRNFEGGGVTYFFLGNPF
jgi:NTE family protein